MNAKNPVLVTTDGSSHSQRILPYAAQLAEALETSLQLLQVLEDDVDADRTRFDLQGALSRLGLNGEVLVETPRKDEEVSAVVLRTANAQQAAVIALDSRGHGALRHLVHGSVALDLLGKTNRPLLVSGPNLGPLAAASATYKIVVTNDGSPASEAVLHALASLLPDEGFEVTLVRVHEHEPGGKDDVSAVADCREQLAAARALLPASLKVETVVREIPRGGGVDTAILETAQSLGAHAIALSTHGQTASRHVIIGSMATTMLGRSALPLLLARSEV